MNKLQKKYAPIMTAVKSSKKDSQTRAILEYLLSREGQKNGLSQMDAYGERFHYCTRLSSIIFALRKKGVDITTERRPKKSGGTYGVYKVVA